MARTKTPVGFIENRKIRRQTFATRRQGLLGSDDGKKQKVGDDDNKKIGKARELAELCGVHVAVVCGDLNGGVPTVLETRPGVLDRYRALPDAHRAQHTHRRYLEDLIVKEKAKLARVQQAGPAALAPPHAVMSQLTLEELRGLLASVDAALAAVAERRSVLGLPGDDRAVVAPHGDSGMSATGGSESTEGCLYPMQQGQGDHGLLDQPTAWQGLQTHDGDMTPPDQYYDGLNMTMQPPHDPEPQYIAGNGAVHLRGPGYQQQMPSNGGYYHRQPAQRAYFQPDDAISLPWNGAIQYDGSSSSHVGTSSSWMQAPSNGNFNSGNFNNGNFNNGAVHDLAIWGRAESSNTLASYPYMHYSGSPSRDVYTDQYTYDNCMNAPSEFLNMSVGGNGMNMYYPDYLGSYEMGTYEIQGSSNNMQYSGASQNSSSEERFWYGSDN